MAATAKKFLNLTAVTTIAVTAVISILGTVTVLYVSGRLSNNNDNRLTAQATSETSNSEGDWQSLSGPEEATPACISHKAVDARGWLQIAKNLDSHVGDCVIVYGVVTQFDAATGSGAFRADADGVKQVPEYGYVNYPTNTLMTSGEADLSDVVEDDLFTAQVTVLGSYTYDTQLGGHTTAPKLRIDAINVTGHLSN